LQDALSITDYSPFDHTMNDLLRNLSSTLLRYLHKLDPFDNLNVLSQLVELFFSVDVTLYRALVDWLVPAFGWSRSEAIVQSTIREGQCPFVITIDSDGRNCVSCLSLRESPESASTSDILDVPYMSADGEILGNIKASIYEGDLVKLRCKSNVTWLVYEIKPRQKKILLTVHKRAVSSDSKARQSRSVNEIEGKRGEERVEDSVRDVIVERRDVCPLELLGAIVWREKIKKKKVGRSGGGKDYDADGCDVGASSFDSFNGHNTEIDADNENCDYDAENYAISNYMDSNAHSATPYHLNGECYVFQMPATPSDIVLTCMKDLVRSQTLIHLDAIKKTKTGLGLRTEKPSVLLSNRTSQTKTPRGLNTQNSLNLGNNRINNYSMNGELKESRPNGGLTHKDRGKESPAFSYSMLNEYQAQASVWLTRESDLQTARHLLWGSDPLCCCLASDRTRWLLTCRALRVICRYNYLNTYCVIRKIM
jgi:hypothetical protein